MVTPSYSTTAYVEVMASDEIGKVVDLFDYKSGDPITMGDEGVYIDQKLSELLKVSVGDTFFLDGDVRGDVTVAGIYEHYTGHFIYMTPGYYENALHADGEPNAYLLNFTSDDTDTCNAIFEKLLDMSGVATTSRMRDTRIPTCTAWSAWTSLWSSSFWRRRRWRGRALQPFEHQHH